MIKVAVLSDIHGNLPALEAVLSDVNDLGINHIIILGDLITDFSQYTNEVLHLVRNTATNVIRGNREGYLINQANNPNDDTWKKHLQFSTLLKTYQRLSEEDFLYLKTLPRQVSFPCDEKYSLRAVHGSPFSELDTIYEDSIDLISRSLCAITENVLLCGHTHRPFICSVNKKTIINVGSVGLSFDQEQSAHYTVIQYDQTDIEINMRKAKYDFSAFMSSCDWDDPWVRLCLKSIEDGKNYCVRFLKEAGLLFGAGPILNDDYCQLFHAWIKKKII